MAIDTTTKEILRRYGWRILAMLILLAGTLGWLTRGGSRGEEARGGAPPVSTPVFTARATARDMPVYLSGIGNVQALYSVLVRSRVDGYLNSVNVQEGQEVKKGALLAVIDPRPYQAALDQAVAQRTRDEAALANAKLDLVRYENLARRDFAPQQQVDTQRMTVDQFQAAIKADEANIEAAALNVSFTHITSPIDGRVGLRLVDPGNLVHATDTNGLITVTQVRPITAIFTLPEQDLDKVTGAMGKGAVEVLAMSSDHQTRLAEGKLLTLDNAVDTTSGTIKLKAIFDNADNRLWPGQFIEGRVRVATLPQAITIPAIAVQRGRDGLFVFVVKPDSTVAQQPVEEALEQDGVAAIKSGVEVGQEVVTNGQSRLASGMRVAARSAPDASNGRRD